MEDFRGVEREGGRDLQKLDLPRDIFFLQAGAVVERVSRVRREVATGVGAVRWIIHDAALSPLLILLDHCCLNTSMVCGVMLLYPVRGIRNILSILMPYEFVIPIQSLAFP